MGKVITIKGTALRNDEGQQARVYFNPETLFEKTKSKDADENAKPAFRRNFLIPKGAPAMDAIIEAATEVAIEKWGKATADKWIKKNLCAGAPISDHCSIRDGDERDEVSEDFANHFFINAKGYKPDTIATKAGVKLWGALDEDEEGDDLDADDVAPYSGAHVKAIQLEIWAYTHGTKNGISVNCLGWRVKDDEAEEMESTGGTSAASMDDLADDDEDDQPVSTQKKAKPKGKK